MGKNLVFAGNYQEYKDFLNENSLYDCDFVYIDSIFTAKKHLGSDIILIGSYYMRYDYDVINAALDIEWGECVND